MKKGLVGKVIGCITGTTIAVGTAFYAIFNPSSFNNLRATDYSVVLNNNNSPIIVNNQSTRVDEKGVTWEYNNVETYASGHVSLKHQGYLGISSNTTWGYTGINGITANFTSNNELWLLTSIDGTNWSEGEILTSGLETHIADSYRYIRFYNWSDTNTSIDINSIDFNYSCSGISATEDVDNTRNVVILNKSDNLTYTSCAGRETTAINFNKSGNSSSWAVIGLDKNYTLEEIRYRTVEFDYYKVNDVPNTQLSYPSIQLYKNATTTVGSTQSYEATKSHYKVTSLGDDWYHIQMPVSALAPTISGYKVGTKWEDSSTKLNSVIGAVKLSVGTCKIDNLRFGSSMSSLGIFNNGTSFNLSDTKPYWFKVAWAGVFHSCTFSFDNSIAEQVTWDDTTCKSPFYVRGLSTGDVTVTATLVVGYNRQTLTISNTLTIN